MLLTFTVKLRFPLVFTEGPSELKGVFAGKTELLQAPVPHEFSLLILFLPPPKFADGFKPTAASALDTSQSSLHHQG